MADTSLRYVKGLSELTARLRALPDKLKKRALRVAVQAGAKIIRDEARRNFRSLWEVRTGRLLKNIVMKFIAEKSRNERVTFYVLVKKVTRTYASNRANRSMRRAGQNYQAEGNAYYWRFLEFGTAYIRAQPFMRPAFESKSQEAIDAIASVLRTELRDLAAKGL